MRRGFWLGLVLLASMIAVGRATLLLGPQMCARPPATFMQPPPVGRWDLVLSLKSSWLVAVIDATGRTHTGRFIGADSASLHVFVQGSEVSVPRVDVIRVDLVQALPASSRTAKQIVAGAAGGALASAVAVGFCHSCAPARSGASGTRVGGRRSDGSRQGAQRDNYDRRPRTIYVAPMRGIYTEGWGTSLRSSER